MLIWGKIIGFLLGGLMLGLPGALIGLILGGAFDRGLRLQMYRRYHSKEEADQARAQQEQERHYHQAQYQQWQTHWDQFQRAWQQRQQQQQQAYQHQHNQSQQNFGSQAHASSSPSDRLRKAYESLGLKLGASAKEVKNAYRRLMNQYHPDKLASKELPEGMLKFAQEKIQEIRSAYDLICETQGFGK